jgi:hypothetical protein
MLPIVPFADGIWEGAVNGAIRGAIIGGVVGGLVGIAVLIMRLTGKKEDKNVPDDPQSPEKPK